MEKPNNIFTKDPNIYYSVQTANKIKGAIKYLKDKIRKKDRVLDIGCKSPMTTAIIKAFNIIIDNTEGDLDISFTTPRNKYDVIIYSHTIEHQFNPLYTLLEIKKLMHHESILYIFLPERGKLLWTNVHYHEIDNYRMRILLERAEFKVLSKKYFKERRS